MNSKAIYGIVAAIVMVAGFVAIQPLQQAQAVHTTILSASTQVRSLSVTAVVVPAAGNVVRTLTCNAPFEVLSVLSRATVDDAGDDTRAITADYDGAGADYTGVVVIGAIALGAQGTTVADSAFGTQAAAVKATALGAGGTVAVTIADVGAGAGDLANVATAFTTTNQATCTLS